MRIFRWLATAVGVMILSTVPPAGAAEPGAPPCTIWNFFGIPQAWHACCDAHCNAKGNHPKLERKPPLKRIADPANLESPNPAIKAAAKIKAEEDLAQQKVKAIKYLGTIGCGCYPGVREALSAALDDCTEEVRYEAAIAFCEAAGNPCKVCNNTGCCNAAVMTKLQEMAQGTDAQGCPKESSARVRAAASNALGACRRVVPQATAGVGETKELPEVPPGTAPKETPTPAERPLPSPPVSPTVPEPRASQFPASPGANQRAPWTEDGVRWSLGGLPAYANTSPAQLSQVGYAQAGTTAGEASAAEAEAADASPFTMTGHGARNRRPHLVCPPCPWPGAAPAAPAAPGAAPEEAPAAPSTEAAPAPGALAGNFGATSGPGTAAPNMIGDLFPGQQTFGVTFGDTTVAIAGGDRRMKMCEYNSPLPQDRVFFLYNHFQGPLLDAAGQSRNLDRATFGLEKTFWSDCWSLEVRVPFASALNAQQSTVDGATLTATEFGNVPLVLKRLLLRREQFALSAGLAMIFPTGRDAELNVDDSFTIRVRNEAFHLQPFLGALWTPNDCWFVTTFAQVDFDVNGNQVQVDDQRGTRDLGTLPEQNLLWLDLAVGRWIYRNPCARCLTGIAPAVELHYTTTMQDAVFVNGIGNPANRQDVLDLTAGLHFQLGALSTLTVSGVAPLSSGDNKPFDAEAIVQFNRRF